jgi:VanZ family protein
MPDSEIDTIHHLLRKCCHLMEYAILALLIFRALSHSRTNLFAWSWPRVGGTLLIVFLYAASDEYHQSFVPGRTALFSDVCIDTGGGAIGLLLALIYHTCLRHKK